MSATPAGLFDRSGWWNEACDEFRSLRAVSAFRYELLGRWLPRGFTGLSVVDLGCGGGLLAVPMAAAGARVLGVDLGQAAVRDGVRRAARGFCGVVGDLDHPPIAAGTADLVLLADVLEHVKAPAASVAAAASLLAPGGLLFVNTISRTWRSRLLAITLAEGLGFVPKGTHRWRDFVRPEELDDMAAANGLVCTHRAGESPRLLATLRAGAIELRESRDLSVGYAALYRRAP